MAFLAYDDKQNKDQNSQNPQLGSGDAGMSGGPTPPGGNLSTSAGTAGAGGQNAFTNIQSYLSANAGNTASQDLLKGGVGKQIEENQKNLTDQATSAQGQAKQAQDTMVNKDQASQLVDQYAGQQGEAYSQAKGKVQGALNYQMPANFSSGFQYAIPGELQQAKTGLQGNNDQFSTLMNNIYSKNVQSPMNFGTSALQSQLDSQNQGLQDTKAQLAGQYGDLEKQASSPEGLAAQTNKQIQDTYSMIPQQQEDLRNYLNSTENQQTTGLEQRSNDINRLGQDIYGSMYNQMSPLGLSVGSGAETINTNAVGPNSQNVVGGQGMRDKYNVIADWLNQQQLSKPDKEVGLENYTYQSAPSNLAPNAIPYWNQLGSFTPMQSLAHQAGHDWNAPVSAQEILNSMNAGTANFGTGAHNASGANNIAFQDPALLKKAMELGLIKSQKDLPASDSLPMRG